MHCAAACNAPVDVVQALLEQNIACAKATDNDGRLPLHLACYHQADTELVSALILAHDHGPREDDIEGKLPVHLALECLIPMWPTVRTMSRWGSWPWCLPSWSESFPESLGHLFFHWKFCGLRSRWRRRRDKNGTGGHICKTCSRRHIDNDRGETGSKVV